MWAIHKQNDEGVDVVEFDKVNHSRLVTWRATEREALEEGIRIAEANIERHKDEIRLEQASIGAFQARLRHLRLNI